MMTQSIVLEVIKIRSLISIIAGAAMLGACSSPVQTESPIESKRASLLRMPEVHGSVIIELNYTLDSGRNVIIRYFDSDGDGKHDMIGYYLNCNSRFGYLPLSTQEHEKLFAVIQKQTLFEDRKAPYGYVDDALKILKEEIPLLNPPICNEDI